MTATLNDDAFADDNKPDPIAVEPHNVVYGSTGWTDALAPDDIVLLVSIGAIRLDTQSGGPGWSACIYRSIEGKR